jgi:catechol 2,3-dioxygenase-like lactoylglutathione lyase family enzyme
MDPGDLKLLPPLRLRGVLETALYAEDLAAAERFYRGALGLEKVSTEAGRHVFFRCQGSILLVFNATQTSKERVVINGGAIPLHGARGAGHVAFKVAREELPAWREHLCAVGIAIESEVSWPNGAHSIYFRDPAGNSLELATPDMWEKAPS